MTIDEGSTNVYADLGYAGAAQMQRKSQVAAEIARAIKARRLTQQGAAALLEIDQSKISRITGGQFRGVSEAKLLELMTRLGHDMKIVVGPVRRRAQLHLTRELGHDPEFPVRPPRSWVPAPPGVDPLSAPQ
jgi:predicted XRE-type DNA-binding protein